MRYLMTFVLICFLSQPVWAQSPTATLAPTGTLRAVFLGGNPVQGRVDEKNGEMSGPVPDLVRELARKLAVPFKIIPAADASVVIDVLKNPTADIGFLGYYERH